LKHITTVAIFTWLLLLPPGLFAQISIDEARLKALRYLQADPAGWGLSASDVSDVRITDVYRTNHNGLTHVWIQQQQHGIPVYGALIGLHIRSNGTILHEGHRFVADLQRRANAPLPSLRPAQALEAALRDAGLTGFPVPPVQQKINDRTYMFAAGSVSKENIPVAACYEPRPDGSVRLAWTLTLAPPASSDHWNYRIDAQTGAVLAKFNNTLYCTAGASMPVVAPACEEEKNTAPENTPSEKPLSAAASYRVFALPLESPAQGNRTLVTEPQNAASPFGWHDINGVPGAEYNYTRGNNTWTYDDSSNQNSGSEAKSVSGGTNMLFDFPLDASAAPAQNRDAALTNLFYMTNTMHDMLYTYGFDEQAGNFQTSNYGKPGFERDPVLAEGLDGGSENNANFTPTPDGFSSQMQMYLWSRVGGRIVQVNAPAGPLQGLYAATTTTGGWGASITSTPVTGEVVAANDGSGASGTLVCNALPAGSLTGKIALVERGVCPFRQKAYNVQQAGAIACVICNSSESQLALGPGTTGLPVTIPVVMLRKSDCDRLRSFAGRGLNISLVQPNDSGPDYLDGSFDNGIIAHEYAHGLSVRLTGGPNTAICLQHNEQMGEGWSDFFTMAMTSTSNAPAARTRTIASYVLRENTDKKGIRSYPYSPDMSINPLTYDHLIDNTFAHTVGEMWAAALWDLYWAMADRYGFDANWNNLNSGNARAVQLVIDGMKIQPCDPGFIDARNAILKADSVNFNGENTCLIWNVFARRGLGANAGQGTPYSAIDGIQGFSLPPACDKRLVISKSAPLDANPGEVLTILLTVTNQQDKTAENVVVSDELPNGLTVTGSTPAAAVGGGQITWNVGNMAPEERKTFTYSVLTNPQYGSARLFRDEMEETTEANWLKETVAGNTGFILQNQIRKTGTAAWKAISNDQLSDFNIALNPSEPVTLSGSNPAIRFWSRYETEAGADGGILEVKNLTDGSDWRVVPVSKNIRNGYARRLQYRTFAITGLYGFSGTQKNWQQAYFDLKEYAGKQIIWRYRFGSDETSGSVVSDGWYIDDVEILDLARYNGTACVTASNTPAICVRAPSGGTLMGFPVVSAEEAPELAAIRVYPNPARSVVHILPEKDLSGGIRCTLFDLWGRALLTTEQTRATAWQSIALDISRLPSGTYILQMDTEAGSRTERIMVH
jgi:extracellular elastinolytic metalloproteinase